MLELLCGAIAALGTTEAENLLTSAGERVIKSYKDASEWKRLIVGTGVFFVKNEYEESSFFHDLNLALSKENLSNIAKEISAEDGYDLKTKLYRSFMQLMGKYEIPYEIAESYTMKIIYVVLEQLRAINPVKYEHFFMKEWREEQENSFRELQNRIEKMSNELTVYNREHVDIASSGQLDIELRRNTQKPSIGIEFFIIDDEHFQDEFDNKRFDEMVFVRGRNREETIFCILNEMWRLNDKRPIYVVRNLDSWKKLTALGNQGNVYIPWFYAEEIPAIENNTNIFVIDENTPTFSNNVLELRPRTFDTLSKCLKNAGMDYKKVYELLTDTHGLYVQIKKKLFRGEYLKMPSWMTNVSERAKKTCLLIGSWEEIEGDKLIIESLYGDSYDRFLEEIDPYTSGEDPLLYVIRHNNTVSYYLASAENIWSYLNVSRNEKIWNSFIQAFWEVINEAENLFTYDHKERFIAQFNGERLFWSETLRKGMLNTLMIKTVYQSDTETQRDVDRLIEELLKCVKTEKQWIYISKFWTNLCEISPLSIMKRLENEWYEDTGLLALFQNQSSDIFFGRNAYINILWGIEQLLLQKDYFWSAFRWLLKLDSYNFDYKSNSPKDIFAKVFCIWMNFSSMQCAEDKVKAAEIGLEIDYHNVWEYLYSSIGNKGRSMLGELSSPKYRDHEQRSSTTIGDMQEAYSGYYRLLINHIDFSVDRWKEMIDLSDDLSEKLRKEVYEKLIFDLHQMTDEEVMQIKNKIRHMIYNHRFFSEADWAMPEEKVVGYENLLNEIKIGTPEFEFCYLFIYDYDFPLLHPIPFEQKGRNGNEIEKEKIIKNRIAEFKANGYNLLTLARVCAEAKTSSLGRYLAKYWGSGEWDFAIFMTLLSVQESGNMAIDYLGILSEKNELPYESIIETLMDEGSADELIARVYRIEAFRTKLVPLVATASETVKREFWKNTVSCSENNTSWVIEESKKYATLEVYLEQLHRINYQTPLPVELILQCFENIECMPHSGGNQMLKYYISQFLGLLQDAYVDDAEKEFRISQIEIFFSDILDWEDMKCFHRMIKTTPILFAQIVAGVFKKDHEQSKEISEDENKLHNMYAIYEKAHFCPTEINGKVDKEQLEKWIVQYRQLLIENDQDSLFGSTLGRLFSYSPLGTDGHEPCEAIRTMIEKYGNEKMINSYRVAVYNRRGVFSPSAGKEELLMANAFKENAQYLDSHYPKTARIFYGLFETYKSESERERKDAENGWF